MPYRRRYVRGRRSYKRYPRKSTGGVDYAKMAMAAYSGVKFLKSIVNVEKKTLESSGTLNPDNTTGTFNCLNLIAQGDTSTARDGNSVLMKKIHINLKFTINSSATHTAMRVILFVDKECNGATPVITDILQAANFLANYNHDEASRFLVLKDMNLGVSITGTQEVSRRIYRRMHIHERFDGTTAAIGDIVDNAIWLFTLSDEATNTPTIAFRSQLIFIDN